MKNYNQDPKPSALKFIFLLGIVSLLADITYEGARSITGPYLALLGASGTIVGIVAGFGELVGYGLRVVFGYLSDRTGRYWLMTILGYTINLLAVPLLALAGHWEIAAVLMISERIGKAIRTPSRDAMLSLATKEIGRGWGFGLHEAMDQIGAMLGPLIIALVLALKGGYKFSFAILLIPALLALTILFVARYLYPKPRDLEPSSAPIATKGFPRLFWLYLLAVALVAFGYVDFPLIAYHFKKVAVVSDNWIPIFYALAMGVDAIAALLFGRLFDRLGVITLVFAVLLSSIFAPLLFLGKFYLAMLGMVLWGVGIGAQESIMRAAIANMIPINKRGQAYGIFNGFYGLFWFLGSALLGIFYDRSIPVLIAFSVISQLTSIPFFLSLRKQRNKGALPL
uniref:MFS transporter n=1 Tax=candidate division WOR-3 bacterium TaxID=2052148 RepID=A0A7C6AAI3_UNCW3